MEKRVFYSIIIKKNEEGELVASSVEFIELNLSVDKAVDCVEVGAYIVYILESSMTPIEAVIEDHEMVNKFIEDQLD